MKRRKSNTPGRVKREIYLVDQRIKEAEGLVEHLDSTEFREKAAKILAVPEVLEERIAEFKKSAHESLMGLQAVKVHYEAKLLEVKDRFVGRYKRG